MLVDEWPSFAAQYDTIGTILSQHTSDVNSARAFAGLQARFAAWGDVRDAELEDVLGAIRPGGLAVVKAARIQAVLRASPSPDPDDQRDLAGVYDSLGDLLLVEGRLVAAEGAYRTALDLRTAALRARLLP